MLIKFADWRSPLWNLVDFLSRYGHSEVPLFTLKEFEEQAGKSGLVVSKRWNWAWLDGFYRFDKK